MRALELLPVVDTFHIVADKRRGVFDCVAETQSGERFRIPLTGFEMEYPYDDLPKGKLVVHGQRIILTDE